jgi:hypothetical protein
VYQVVAMQLLLTVLQHPAITPNSCSCC